MIHGQFGKTSLAAALLAIGFALPALAQTAGTPGTSGASGTPPSGTMASGSADLSRSDRKFIEEAAKGGMAEVQLGKLAAEKADSAQVKQFGQRMVDDHSKANSQLRELASKKNVSLPPDIDRSQQREYDRLQKLSGAQFDREYMKHMVSDHKKDVKEFQKTAKSAKDPDVKSFAQTTLPTLEDHLRQAQTDEAAVKSAGNSKQRQASR